MKIDFNRRCRKFASALEKIDTRQIYLNSVKVTEDLALDLNRSQLYDQGVDSDNKSLGKYSEGTRKQKAKKGQKTSHITLSDTFDFYDKMFIDTKQLPIFIDSKDSKAGILAARYPKALGLTDRSEKEYSKAVTIEYKHTIANEIEKAKEKILS